MYAIECVFIIFGQTIICIKALEALVQSLRFVNEHNSLVTKDDYTASVWIFPKVF